jgi:hypothetical protein
MTTRSPRSATTSCSDERHSQLFAIPLNEDGVADGTPVRLTRLDADVPSRVWGGNEEYAISPDGKTLYFTARLRNRDEPSSTNFDIYAAPMNRGLGYRTGRKPRWPLPRLARDVTPRIRGRPVPGRPA